MAEKNFGMKVNFILDLETIDGNIFKIEYRNVTEIHYNYNRAYTFETNYRTAFESDMHGTGNTWFSTMVKEMEIVPETELQENFQSFCEEL